MQWHVKCGSLQDLYLKRHIKASVVDTTSIKIQHCLHLVQKMQFAPNPPGYDPMNPNKATQGFGWLEVLRSVFIISLAGTLAFRTMSTKNLELGDCESIPATT